MTPDLFHKATKPGGGDSILLGLNVHCHQSSQCKINEWLAVPDRGGQIWMNEAETGYMTEAK